MTDPCQLLECARQRLLVACAKVSQIGVTVRGSVSRAERERGRERERSGKIERQIT